MKKKQKRQAQDKHPDKVRYVPQPSDAAWCADCNGYGSSLKQSGDRCTSCNGTGLKGGQVWW